MKANTARRKERIMKKLAIIGTVVAGLLLSTGVAWAKPTGMTKAEYRALVVRSEGLNQRYGLDKHSQPALATKLEEIGAWAVPSKQTRPVVPVNQQLEEIGAWAVPSKQTQPIVPVDQKLEEIGAWAVPMKQEVSTPIVSEKLGGLGLGTPESSVATTGSGLDWHDVGLGATIAFVGLLGIGGVLTLRQHTPIAY
jgi:hypothetical protein